MEKSIQKLPASTYTYIYLNLPIRIHTHINNIFSRKINFRFECTHVVYYMKENKYNNIHSNKKLQIYDKISFINIYIYFECVCGCKFYIQITNTNIYAFIFCIYYNIYILFLRGYVYLTRKL